jgi:hypothetical protein
MTIKNLQNKIYLLYHGDPFVKGSIGFLESLLRGSNCLIHNNNNMLILVLQLYIMAILKYKMAESLQLTIHPIHVHVHDRIIAGGTLAVPSLVCIPVYGRE